MTEHKCSPIKWPYDYCYSIMRIHSTLSHNTKSAERYVRSTQLIMHIIFFSHSHMELKFTWLWSFIHANRYLHDPLSKKNNITDSVVGISLKKRQIQGVNQYNRMRKSRVRAWAATMDLVSFLSVSCCYQTMLKYANEHRHVHARMLVRLRRQLVVFDVTNLIWINRNEYFLFLMRDSNKTNRKKHKHILKFYCTTSFFLSIKWL